jgi:hypothetical protein
VKVPRFRCVEAAGHGGPDRVTSRWPAVPPGAKRTLVGAPSLAGEKPLLDHFLGGRIGDLVHQVVDILGVNSVARARP